MTTLRDIAKRAGVSAMTVSRVLNDKGAGKVGAKTRARVTRIAAEMGYQPNLAARALRNQSTLQVGLVLPNVDLSFMPSIVEGLQSVAMASNYSCLLYVTGGDPEKERNVFQFLLAKGVDGIIWLPCTTNGLSKEIHTKGVPMLQLLYKEEPDFPALLVDQEHGSYQAAQHLIDLGHRRIGYLAVQERHGYQRLNGYKRALADAGVPFDKALVNFSSSDLEDCYRKAKELLGKNGRITAVMASTDMCAWGTLRAAQDLGLDIPGDVSLTGFDDVFFAKLLEPPLTTVAQPKNELGRLAMQILTRYMNGESVADTTIPASLVMRQSTAPPR